MKIWHLKGILKLSKDRVAMIIFGAKYVMVQVGVVYIYIKILKRSIWRFRESHPLKEK